jgi:hypothetical protein
MGAGIPKNTVVPGATIEELIIAAVSTATIQRIVPSTPEYGIISIAANQNIVQAIANDSVIASAAKDIFNP